jgi:hypothetical protein
MRTRLSLALALAAFALGIAACGGGGGGGGTPATASPTSTPVVAPTSQATSAPLSTSGTTPVTLGAVSSNGSTAISSGTITLPAVGSATTASVTMQATLPSGAPVPATRNLKTRFVIGGSNINPLAYFLLSVNPGTTISSSPAFSVTFPSAIGGSAYVAVLDSNNPAQGWNVLLGPVTASGNTLTFQAQSITPFTLAANDVYIFCIFTATITPTPSPSTPSPSASPSSGPTTSPTAVASPSASPLTGPTAGTASNGNWTATDVATQLNFPVQHGYNGAGQTVGIIIDADPTSQAAGSDLASYLSFNQTPTTGRTITPEAVNGGGGSSDGAFEAALDVQTIAGLAPGANIIVYVLPDLSGQSIEDGITKAVSDNTAKVVSMSFGGCEFGGANGSGNGEHTEFALGAQSQGQAFFASGGDQGNECFTGAVSPAPQYTPGPNYPASDPNVIGVGGNETWQFSTPAYTLTNPIAWNDMNFGTPPAQGASGGGVSALFSPAPWQAGYGQSSTFRNVPDIAMPAEGTLIYHSGAGGASGTSWSAPQAAALMAEVYEYCQLPNGTANPNETFYHVQSLTGGPAAFIDVTSGNNQYAGSMQYYTAMTGFDNVTGFGVVKGWSFATALCPNRVPALSRFASVQRFTMPHAAAQPMVLNAPALSQRLADRGRRDVIAQTRIQIALRPGPSIASDESAVIAQLQAAGFTIVQTFGNHTLVDAVGPSGSIERFFGTPMHDYDQGRFGTRYGPSGPITVPASIAPYVNAVSLDNFIIATHLSEDPFRL